MPKSVSTIVSEINDLLQKNGGPVITFPWPDFYKLCAMERFKDPRPQRIAEEAKDKYQLTIAYGRNVVVVAHDRNFASVSA